MKILVTGASGFVGNYLCQTLLGNGHSVIGIGRSAKHELHYSKKLRLSKESKASDGFEDFESTEDRFEWVSADTTLEGSWQDKVKTSDVIINLTGKNIFGYWTKEYKNQIYNSRILTTKNIVSAFSDLSHVGKKQVLLNTSAIGYYGDRGEESLTEEDSAGNDFLAKVCVDWEKEALKAEEKGARVVLMRFGVVLGKDGGALSKMLPAFKFFAGGPLGKGTHWFPWIHIDDLLRAVLFLIENENVSGAINFVAPESIRHKEFASSLGHTLNRPAFMPAPAFMIKTIMGEMGLAFLSSQKAKPYILNKSGFKFKYGDIESALKDIVLSE
ncbi:MAG: TIGR01777 family protein [Desulfamplus sp.]|nr:TIGR01777 family protein [Desulfamplus sp.]